MVNYMSQFCRFQKCCHGLARKSYLFILSKNILNKVPDKQNVLHQNYNTYETVYKDWNTFTDTYRDV